MCLRFNYSCAFIINFEYIRQIEPILWGWRLKGWPNTIIIQLLCKDKKLILDINNSSKFYKNTPLTQLKVNAMFQVRSKSSGQQAWLHQTPFMNVFKKTFDWLLQ